MLRLVTITLLSVSFLTLGMPLCCVIGDNCCQQAPEPESKEPACPHCPREREPERTPTTCDCADHGVDIAVAETAPEFAPDLVVITAAPEQAAAISAIAIPHGKATTPARAHAPRTLPLLL